MAKRKKKRDDDEADCFNGPNGQTFTEEDCREQWQKFCDEIRTETREVDAFNESVRRWNNDPVRKQKIDSLERRLAESTESRILYWASRNYEFPLFLGVLMFLSGAAVLAIITAGVISSSGFIAALGVFLFSAGAFAAVIGAIISVGALGYYFSTYAQSKRALAQNVKLERLKPGLPPSLSGFCRNLEEEYRTEKEVRSLRASQEEDDEPQGFWSSGEPEAYLDTEDHDEPYPNEPWSAEDRDSHGQECSGP